MNTESERFGREFEAHLAAFRETTRPSVVQKNRLRNRVAGTIHGPRADRRRVPVRAWLLAGAAASAAAMTWVAIDAGHPVEKKPGPHAVAKQTIPPDDPSTEAPGVARSKPEVEGPVAVKEPWVPSVEVIDRSPRIDDGGLEEFVASMQRRLLACGAESFEGKYQLSINALGRVIRVEPKGGQPDAVGCAERAFYDSSVPVSMGVTAKPFDPKRRVATIHIAVDQSPPRQP